MISTIPADNESEKILLYEPKKIEWCDNLLNGATFLTKVMKSLLGEVETLFPSTFSGEAKKMRYFIVIVVAGFISVPALASMELSDKYGCSDCHRLEVKPGAVRKKKEGPSYKEIGEKHKGQKGAEKILVDIIKKGSKGVWAKKLGKKTEMDGDDDIPVKDAEAMVKWMLSL
jgi:cytochrome c